MPVRLFLNRSEAGAPALEDVTEAAGSPGLPTKSPHVSIVDLDDDGLADVVTSAAAADGSPLVLHNTGVDDGVPRFAVVGEPGDGEYWVTGVTDDLDQDGRVDVFLVSWEPAVALETSWRTFTTQWQAFCYPGTDDVTISPLDERWVLCYHHWEAFSFTAR